MSADRHQIHAKAFRTLGSEIRLIVLALVFAALTLSVPWEDLRGGFIDLIRYRTNFAEGSYVYYRSDTAFGWWRSEALWRWGITALAKSSGGFETAFNLVSAFILVVCAVYVSRSTRSAAYLPLLISPAFIDLAFSQIRSGSSMALLYIAIMLARRPITRLFAPVPAIASIFIHNFTIVVAALWLAFLALKLLPMPRFVRTAILVAALLLVGACLSIFRDEILGSVGDRRAFQSGQVGGTALAAMILLYSTAAWIKFKTIALDINTYLCISLSFIHIVFYFSGQPGGARLLAMALPALTVVLANMQDLTVRRLLYASIVFFNLVYFTYWIGGNTYV